MQLAKRRLTALPAWRSCGGDDTNSVSNYQNLPSRIELDLASSGNTGVIEYRYDTEGRQISRWSWEEDPVGAKVAGTEGNEWSYYDALGRLDARVGVDGGVLDQRLVNLLTEYTDPPNEPGLWLRSQFHPANAPNDLPLPGSLTRTWSTYGARGLVAQTHAPMTGIQPLESDVLHGELVLNDHLGSPRLRLESQLQAVVDDESENPTQVLDWVLTGWMPKNPMDYTPFGRELAQDNSAKTTPEGNTGKPLGTTFGLNWASCRAAAQPVPDIAGEGNWVKSLSVPGLRRNRAEGGRTFRSAKLSARPVGRENRWIRLYFHTDEAMNVLPVL